VKGEEQMAITTFRFVPLRLHFGHSFKEWRRSLGLTQGEFARLLGSSQPRVSRWEKRESPPWTPYRAAFMVDRVRSKQPKLAPKLKEILAKWYHLDAYFTNNSGELVDV